MIPVAKVVWSAAVVACLLAALPARADLLPAGKHYVPLALTLDGQEAFADTTFVVGDCSPDGSGRHWFTFAKPKEPVRCRQKAPATIHAVPTKDRKALDDLFAKDLGWAAEGIEARKLLEKAQRCGAIDEKTLVDTAGGITEVAATYAIEKTAAGCSLKRTSSTNVMGASSTPAPSAAPSAAPAAPPAPARSGCAAAPSRSATGAAGTGAAPVLVVALAVLGMARRNRRRLAGS